MASNIYITCVLTYKLRQSAIHRRSQYIMARLLRLTLSNCAVTASLSIINAVLLPIGGRAISAQCVRRGRYPELEG